jgi:anti-anti-sigma factor
MLQTERHGAITLVRLSTMPLATTVDVRAPEQTWAKLDAMVGDAPAGSWLIDVSQERFLNSEALAVMIGMVRNVQSAGGRIALVGCSAGVVNIITSMRLSRMLPLYPDLVSGLTAFAQPPASST